MRYRIYLLDSDNHIRAGESFTADNDTDAQEVGFWLYDAARDVFDGYEVWRGTHRVGRTERPRPEVVPPPKRLEAVIEMRQRNVIELEERLHSTFECVSKSRMLLQRCEQIRSGWI
jgi:hypothetical protein